MTGAAVITLLAVVSYLLLKDSWDKAWLVFVSVRVVTLSLQIGRRPHSAED